MASLADLTTAVQALTQAVTDLQSRLSAGAVVPQAEVDAVNAATSTIQSLAPPQ